MTSLTAIEQYIKFDPNNLLQKSFIPGSARFELPCRKNIVKMGGTWGRIGASKKDPQKDYLSGQYVDQEGMSAQQFKKPPPPKITMQMASRVPLNGNIMRIVGSENTEDPMSFVTSIMPQNAFDYQPDMLRNMPIYDGAMSLDSLASRRTGYYGSSVRDRTASIGGGIFSPDMMSISDGMSVDTKPIGKSYQDSQQQTENQPGIGQYTQTSPVDSIENLTQNQETQTSSIAPNQIVQNPMSQMATQSEGQIQDSEGLQYDQMQKQTDKYKQKALRLIQLMEQMAYQPYKIISNGNTVQMVSSTKTYSFSRQQLMNDYFKFKYDAKAPPVAKLAFMLYQNSSSDKSDEYYLNYHQLLSGLNTNTFRGDSVVKFDDETLQQVSRKRSNSISDEQQSSSKKLKFQSKDSKRKADLEIETDKPSKKQRSQSKQKRQTADSEIISQRKGRKLSPKSTRSKKPF